MQKGGRAEHDKKGDWSSGPLLKSGCTQCLVYITPGKEVPERELLSDKGDDTSSCLLQQVQNPSQRE